MCKRAADSTQKSAHVDFDAPVSGLGNALGSRNQRFALAAGGNFDAIGGSAALDKVVAHTLRPQPRQLIVELRITHRVGMPDDQNFRIRSGGDFGKDTLELALGFWRQLVISFKEVKQECRGPCGKGGHHRGKFARCPGGVIRDELHRAGAVDMRAGISLVQENFLAILGPDDDATDRTVRLGQQDDKIIARQSSRRAQCLRFDRLRGIAPANRLGICVRLGTELRTTGHHDRRDDGRCGSKTHLQLAAGSSTFTMNSVPRTPMIAAGVLIRMASGDCLTILPETTASVPFLRRVSNSPWWVVLSNTKRSITSSLFGPADNKLLSWKVMPTEPSAPVFTVSSTSMTVPTGAAISLPLRSICTPPLDTLMRPASPANACVHIHAPAKSRKPNTRVSLWNVDTLVILPPSVLNRRVGKCRRSQIHRARTMHVNMIAAGSPLATRGKCLFNLRKTCTA